MKKYHNELSKHDHLNFSNPTPDTVKEILVKYQYRLDTLELRHEILRDLNMRLSHRLDEYTLEDVELTLKQFGMITSNTNEETN